jgi:hypothetical protein
MIRRGPAIRKRMLAAKSKRNGIFTVLPRATPCSAERIRSGSQVMSANKIALLKA